MEDGGTVGRWDDHNGRVSDLDDATGTDRASSVVAPNQSPSLIDGTNSRNLSLSAGDSNANINHGNSVGGQQGRNSTSSTRLPPIKQHAAAKSTKATAANRRASGSTSVRRGKATGSRTPSPSRGAAAVSRRSASSSARSSRSASLSKGSRKGSPGKGSRPASRGKVSKGSTSRKGSPSGKSASGRSASVKRKSSPSKGKGKGSPSKRKGSPSKRKGSPSKRKGSPGKKGSSVKGRRKSGLKKRSPSRQGSSREDVFLATLRVVTDEELVRRAAVEVEEDTERETYLPEYNLLAMNMVHSQVVQVNRRQQLLNEAFKALQSHGVHLSSGQDANAAIETLRTQLRADVQGQAETLRLENASLRGLLDEKRTELEQRNTEVQGLRDKINRKLMRYEVEGESLKAEVQSVLQTTHLDVDRMKRDLSHRLDVATASLRTPKYDTALRSMQDLVRSVQEEIQEHHDTMAKMIVSIGALDTFLRDKSESMHSNFPMRYRDELRRLDKDQLLNLLDVLSFQDEVIETVGKALYVHQKMEHNTNVF